MNSTFFWWVLRWYFMELFYICSVCFNIIVNKMFKYKSKPFCFKMSNTDRFEFSNWVNRVIVILLDSYYLSIFGIQKWGKPFWRFPICSAFFQDCWSVSYSPIMASRSFYRIAPIACLLMSVVKLNGLWKSSVAVIKCF